MATLIRRSRAKNNIVTNPPKLPIELLKGSFSFSLSFEQQPQASLNAEAIPQSQIIAYRRAYAVDTIFEFYGVLFIVKNYSESLNSVFYPGIGIVNAYDVSVTFGGRWETNASNTVRIIQGRDKTRVNQVNLSLPSTNYTNPEFAPNITSQGDSQFILSQLMQGSTTREYRKFISLGVIASKCEVPYTGPDVSVEVPTEVTANYETSFGSELPRVRIKGAYFSWSGKRLVAKDITAGNRWDFTRDDVIYSIQTSTQHAAVYNNTVLSGEFRDDRLPGGGFQVFVDEDTLNQKKKAFGTYKRVPPERLTLVEGDSLLTEPPKDTKIVKTLDQNWDGSGPKKTQRIVTTLDGNPFIEEVRIYGFVYLTTDIASNDDLNPLKGDIRDKWQLIEYQRTTYIYEPVEAQISAYIVDDQNRYVSTYKISSPIRFNNARYLTTIDGFGQKVTRFRQEQTGSDYDKRVVQELLGNPQTVGLDRAYFNAVDKAITPFTTSIKSRTSYLLVPANNFYENAVGDPYQIDRQLADSLPDGGSFNNRDSYGYVYFQTPNPDYVIDLLVIEEMTEVKSFEVMDNPDNIYLREDRKTATDPNEIKLVEPLTTGQDTLNRIKRQIVPSANTTNTLPKPLTTKAPDIYVEYIVEQNSQDARFKGVVENSRYRQIAGRPPTGSYIKDRYERREDRDDTFESNSKNKNRPKTRYLQSDLVNDESPIGGSVSYPTDKLSEALVGAKTDLIINDMQNTIGEEVNLAWFYPYIREGDFISTPGSPTRRVKSMSFQLRYEGRLNGKVLVLCDGTQLSLGVNRDRTITVRNEYQPIDRTGGGDTNKGDGGYEVRYSARTKIPDPLPLGSLFSEDLMSRRNVSENQDYSSQ